MKYGQKIRVTSGFYEGMEGKVIRESIYTDYGFETLNSSIQSGIIQLNKKVSYKCLLKNGLDEIESDYIPESSLELIK